MRLSIRFWVLTSVLVLASLGSAFAAPKLRPSQPRSFYTQTVDCWVQCYDPPHSYYMPGVTIEQCCSYVSGSCYGTGYGSPAVDGCFGG